jgi:hypothetical protein
MDFPNTLLLSLRCSEKDVIICYILGPPILRVVKLVTNLKCHLGHAMKALLNYELHGSKWSAARSSHFTSRERHKFSRFFLHFLFMVSVHLLYNEEKGFIGGHFNPVPISSNFLQLALIFCVFYYCLK